MRNDCTRSLAGVLSALGVALLQCGEPTPPPPRRPVVIVDAGVRNDPDQRGDLLRLIAGKKVRWTWAAPGDWVSSPADRMVATRWSGQAKTLRFTRSGDLHRVNGKTIAVELGKRAPGQIRETRLGRGVCAIWRGKLRVPKPAVKSLQALGPKCLMVELHGNVSQGIADLKPIAAHVRGLSANMNAIALTHMRALKNLEVLDLTTHQLWDKQLTSGVEIKLLVKALAPMRKLRVLYLDSHDIESTQGRAAAALPPLPKLRRLESKQTVGPLLTRGLDFPRLRVLVGRFWAVPEGVNVSVAPRLRVVRRLERNGDEIDSLGEIMTLEILDLRGLPLRGSVASLGRLKNLRILRLGGHNMVTDAGEIIAGCRRLERLHMRSVPISPAGARKLGLLSQIQHLDLWGTGLSDKAVPAALAWKHIRHLELGGTKVGSAWMARLTKLKGLRHLGLAGTAIAPKDVRSIAALVSLESLDLSETSVQDAQLKSLGKLSRLKTLLLAMTSVTNAGMASVAALGQLQTLVLRATAINDTGISHLSRLQSMRRMDLSLTGATSQGVAALFTMSKLEWLSLAETPVRGGNRAWPFTKLRTLLLQGSDFDEASIARLDGLRALRHLNLADSRVQGSLHRFAPLKSLQKLDLSSTRVDCSGVVKSLKLPSLKLLKLEGTLVDDRLFKLLAGSPRLKELHLAWSKVSSGTASVFSHKHKVDVYQQ